MKTSILKLERVFLTIGLLMISLNINSQDNKLSRQEQKEIDRNKDYYNFQVVDSLLERKSFVLMANYLENQYGYRVPVFSNVNFVMVDSPQVVLQTGNNYSFGYNGVGGVTAKGNINNLKIEKDFKHLNFFLKFTVMTNIGIYDVAMTINSDGRAQATITGLTFGRLVYDGYIETIDNSGIYKGQDSI